MALVKSGPVTIYIVKRTAAGFDLVSAIDNYETLSFSRSLFNVGTFTFDMLADSLQNKFVEVDNFIVVSDSYASTSYRVGIIQTVDRSIGEDSKKILHVEGQEAKALLGFRMVDPGTSSRYTSSAVFETAVKALVNSQCGATATDTNRVFPGFTVAPTQGRGAAYVFSERWSNLSEAVQKACINVTTGYTIYWSGSGLVFDTLYGVNRTLGNNVNNPAIFSTDFDTVKESHFTLSKASYKNYVYAGGQGVGTARVIQPVFSGATAPSGYLRREMFSDARDLSATADLTVRGTQELTANSYQQFTEAVINPYATFSQSSGVDLGDLCTVDAFGYQTTSRITGVNEQWSGAGYDCSLSMDRSRSTVESVIANEKYVANRAGSYVEGYIIESGGTAASTGYWERFSNGKTHMWGVFTTTTAWQGSAPSYYAIDLEFTLPTPLGATANSTTITSGFRSTDAYPIRTSFSVTAVNKIKGSIECTSNYSGNKYINWEVWGIS
jgi:hypothetical protein